MPTLKEILAKKNKRLSDIPDEFLTKIQKIQRQFFTDLIARLDAIEKSGGFIDANISNLNEVLDIDVGDVLGETGYEQAVKDFEAEFEAQKKVNDQYFKEVDEAFKPTKFADKILAEAKEDAVQRLVGAPLNEKFLKPIEDLLFDSVASGSSWRDTVASIREFAEGSDEVDGKLLQYSKQIAHDSFAYADRAYSNAIADELESEWFLYSGGEIDTSRCFCIERHQKYYHYKEIENWGRGNDLGECNVDGLWAGADRNTNEKTIFIYVGGHNCRHSLMPVSVFDVPKEVLTRNIENGNYDPSEKEMELLGL